jgi:hypothetical protein
MPVIAMTQEMGSLAKDVALQLAETAGLAVMRHEVLENVAGRMHVPGSLISRLREGKAGLVERCPPTRSGCGLHRAGGVCPGLARQHRAARLGRDAAACARCRTF